MMIIKKVLSAALASAVMVSPMTAFAADLDNVVYADDANMLQSAELGSNWYIRGELGFNFAGDHDTSVYGNPAESVYLENNFMDSLHYNAGVGYRINKFLRVDANIGRLQGSDYRSSQLMYEAGTEPVGTDPDLIVDPLDPNPCNGWGTFVDTSSGVISIGDDFIENCIRTDTAEYDTTYSMVNAYVDLPQLMGFRPFFGGGVGVGRVSWRQELGAVDCVPGAADIRQEGCSAYGVVDQPPANTPYTQPGTTDNGVNYRLGYQLAAGIGYDITPNMTLDTTYRYTYFGGTSFDAGDGATIAADGYSTHQVNVGLRYSIW